MKYNQEILLKEAREAIREKGYASTPLLQRKLRIGYITALELLDILEKNGEISHEKGAKPREILKLK